MISDTHCRRWDGNGWVIDAVRSDKSTGINVYTRDVLTPAKAHAMAAALTEAAVFCGSTRNMPRRRVKRRMK